MALSNWSSRRDQSAIVVTRLEVDEPRFFTTLLTLPKGPVLSVKVHSPTEGVIGVKLDHFAHSAPFPVIPLFPDDEPIPNSTLQTTESGCSLTSGGLTAEITTNPYTITFKSPTRTLTFAGPKHQGIFEVPSRWTTSSASQSSCLALDPSSNPTPAPLPDVVRYINSELNISPGELVYGFGEQFGAFVKNGQCAGLPGYKS